MENLKKSENFWNQIKSKPKRKLSPRSNKNIRSFFNIWRSQTNTLKNDEEEILNIDASEFHIGSAFETNNIMHSKIKRLSYGTTRFNNCNANSCTKKVPNEKSNETLGSLNSNEIYGQNEFNIHLIGASRIKKSNMNIKDTENNISKSRKSSKNYMKWCLSSRYDDENEWGCTNWCEYVIVVVLAALLLIASLTLTLFWIMYYREGFSWDTNPKQQFNLHPVLMVAGFITFSGFSMLLYRICRCFRRIYVKLIHTIFHALAIPCIVVGFLAVLEYHNNSDPPIPNFYSMHSWLGFITMGLFALQFVFGFFSFLILLCCEGSTAAFRASMVPIHASFGLTTFMLAIATCLTGLTEKAIFTLGDEYSKGNLEGLVMNVLAVVLVALGILISYTVRSTAFRPDDSTVFHANKITKVMSSSTRASSAGPY